MKSINTRKSRVFFIEFLIVLFFFLIISTVCLRLFVRAHQITEKADALSRAQNLAASVAEVLTSGYDTQELLLSYFPGAVPLSEANLSPGVVPLSEANLSPASADSNIPDLNSRTPSGIYMTYDRSFRESSDQIFYTMTVELQPSFTEIADPENVGNDSAAKAAYHDMTSSVRICDRNQEILYELTVNLHRPMTREEVLS